MVVEVLRPGTRTICSAGERPKLERNTRSWPSIITATATTYSAVERRFSSSTSSCHFTVSPGIGDGTRWYSLMSNEILNTQRVPEPGACPVASGRVTCIMPVLLLGCEGQMRRWRLTGT